MVPKTYLGDAVYAEDRGDYHLVLTTENGETTDNIIFLDPDVCKALVRYMDRIKEDRKQNAATDSPGS